MSMGTTTTGRSETCRSLCGTDPRIAPRSGLSLCVPITIMCASRCLATSRIAGAGRSATSSTSASTPAACARASARGRHAPPDLLERLLVLAELLADAADGRLDGEDDHEPVAVAAREIDRGVQRGARALGAVEAEDDRAGHPVMPFSSSPAPRARRARRDLRVDRLERLAAEEPLVAAEPPQDHEDNAEEQEPERRSRAVRRRRRSTARCTTPRIREVLHRLEEQEGEQPAADQRRDADEEEVRHRLQELTPVIDDARQPLRE